jgi:hypothetical protein
MHYHHDHQFDWLNCSLIVCTSTENGHLGHCVALLRSHDFQHEIDPACTIHSSMACSSGCISTFKLREMRISNATPDLLLPPTSCSRSHEAPEHHVAKEQACPYVTFTARDTSRIEKRYSIKVSCGQKLSRHSGTPWRIPKCVPCSPFPLQ